MNRGKWLIVVVVSLSVGLGVAAWLFWPLITNESRLNQLRIQQGINQKLQTIQESTTNSFDLLNAAIAAAPSKEKLNPREVGLLRESLDLYKMQLDVAEGELDKLLTTARKQLDGDILERVTASIQLTRTHLDDRRAAHADLVKVFSQRFETPLDRAIQGAFKSVEEALKELEKEQEKDKAKPKP